MIYVIQVLWIGIASLICSSSVEKSPRTRKIFLAMVFVPCFFMMAFRDVSVGIDTKNYKAYFETLASIPWSTFFSGEQSISMEFGWSLVNKICGAIVPSYYFFQIIYASVFCYFSAKFLELFSDSILISTMCYLGLGTFIVAFNVQRQLLAVVILANSFWYLSKKKYFKMAVLLFLAVSMHQTAIIFVCAYIVYWLKERPMIIKISAVVWGTLIIRFELIINIAQRIFPQYINYFDNHKDVQTASGVWVIWIIIIVLAVFAIYFNRKKKQDSLLALYGLFGLIYVGSNIIGLSFNYFERIGLYFLPFVALLFDRFALRLQSNFKAVYKIGVVVSFGVYYLLSCLIGSALDYKFFF